MSYCAYQVRHLPRVAGGLGPRRVPRDCREPAVRMGGASPDRFRRAPPPGGLRRAPAAGTVVGPPGVEAVVGPEASPMWRETGPVSTIGLLTGANLGRGEEPATARGGMGGSRVAPGSRGDRCPSRVLSREERAP